VKNIKNGAEGTVVSPLKVTLWKGFLYFSMENPTIYCGDNNGIYDSILKSSDTGIIIGVGYQLKRFLFDVRYSKGITEINEMPGDREYSSGIDNFYQFIFSVVFLFK